MAETSTIFGFMKYVSATDILSDFKKTVDSHFVNSLKGSKLNSILFLWLVMNKRKEQFYKPLFIYYSSYFNASLPQADVEIRTTSTTS